jgi:hypothetical protein
MTVTNACWKTREDAEAAAQRYIRHGYNVRIIEHRLVADNSLQLLTLSCTPRN